MATKFFKILALVVILSMAIPIAGICPANGCAGCSGDIYDPAYE